MGPRLKAKVNLLPPILPLKQPGLGSATHPYPHLKRLMPNLTGIKIHTV